MEEEERAEWIGLQAVCLQELGRSAEAIDRARKAVEIDPDCAVAKEVLEKSQ
jgi:hypothetical protein